MFQDATPRAIRMQDGGIRALPAERAGPMLAWNEMPSLLLRRWRWVAGGILAGLVVALAAVALLPASYTASTEVLVQPTDLKALEGAVNQVSNQPDTSVALLESAARVFASRRVLEPVVAKLKLVDDPEFQRHPSWLRELLAAVRDDGDTTQTPALIALDELGKHVTVRRTERTFVIGVSVKSKDAAKAARIAAAIVASFFEVQGDARAEAARHVSDALTARLSGLRDDVRRNEDAVQAYKVANNLSEANGQIVNEQQLSEASAQLLAAQKATADAKAKLEEVQSALQGRDPGAIPEALRSQAVTELRAALAQVRQQEAYTATVYGERYPLLAKIRSKVAVARRALDGEVQRIRNTARGEYERAQASEANLRANLARQQTTSTSMNAARIKLRELEREADASRGIYADSLRRSRETAEQEGVDTLNAWVISPAVVPDERSFPPPNKLMLAGGFIVGLALGLALAVLRERMDPRLWTRSQAEAATGVPVLATIEASRNAAADPGVGWETAPFRDGRRVWQPDADALAGVVQQLAGDDLAARDRIVLVLASDFDDAWLTATRLGSAALGEGQTTTLVRLGRRPTGSLRQAKGGRLASDQSVRLVELIEPSELGDIPASIERLRGIAAAAGGLVIVAIRQGSPILPQLARLADARLLVLDIARSTRAEAQSLARRLRLRTGALQGAILVRWAA